jgi:hypothetical protein
VRTPGPDGRSVFTARTPDVPQACDALAALASPLAKSLVIPTASQPVQSAAQGEHPVVGVVQHFGGWRLLSEVVGRCPRRASSGFHPKRKTPFRVRGEREDGVAFSAPEKPPDACTPATRIADNVTCLSLWGAGPAPFGKGWRASRALASRLAALTG